MRVTVIGGTGFIGRTVAQLLRTEHAVVAVGLPGEPRPPDGPPPMEADVVRDAVALEAVLRDAEAVVYALAPRGVGEPLDSAMTTAAARVAIAAARSGVRRWVHLSNVSVYPSGPDWVEDDSPAAPGYPLGEATLRMEEAVGAALAGAGVRTTLLRLGPVYAADDLDGLSHSYVEPGDNWISPVERSDVARAVGLALTGALPAVCVVGDGAPVSAGEAARVAARRRERPVHPVGAARARGFGPDAYGRLTSSVRLRPAALLTAGWRPVLLRDLVAVPPAEVA